MHAWHVVLAASLAATTPAVAQEHAHAGAQPAAAAALGTPGDVARVTRTIEVRMSDDMRFTPARIAVRRGETVRFRVRNAGALEHEMVLGDAETLARHAAAMRAAADASPAHDHGHQDGHADVSTHSHEHAAGPMVAVAPGRTADLVWRFTRAGQVRFACLLPGHLEAGMSGAIDVR